MKQIVKLRVNGVEEEKAVHTHHTLLEVLRAEFKLFGAREGCGIGMCGACTVLLDGKPTSSCLLLAALAEGKEILTIEGLAEHGTLHPIQQAFIDVSWKRIQIRRLSRYEPTWPAICAAAAAM